MLILTLILLLTIFGSFFFSGSETGFVSWNPLKVAHAAAQGDFRARLAMRFVNNRGQFLSTVLIGNNICNVLAPIVFAMLFAEIDRMTALGLSRVPSPESLILTPILLIFGEVLPKSLYRIYAFRLTMKSMPVLTVLYFLFYPLLWVFGVISKLFRGSGGDVYGADVREEIVLVAVEGAKRGHIFESADDVMKNTLEMKGKCVRDYDIALDEWRKTRPVYRVSQTLSEFSPLGMPHAGEAAVFDDEGKYPVGYVSLLDAAAHRGKDPGDIGGMKTLGALMKPLPRIKGDTEALRCIRITPQDSPRFYAVVDNGEITALLDKMEIFKAAFARQSLV